MSFDFLQLEFLNNQILDYLIALTVLIVGFIAIKLLRNIFVKRLKRWARKTERKLDDALLRLIESDKPIVSSQIHEKYYRFCFRFR
jgi:hypothetical protein